MCAKIHNICWYLYYIFGPICIKTNLSFGFTVKFCFRGLISFKGLLASSLFVELHLIRICSPLMALCYPSLVRGPLLTTQRTVLSYFAFLICMWSPTWVLLHEPLKNKLVLVNTYFSQLFVFLFYFFLYNNSLKIKPYPLLANIWNNVFSYMLCSNYLLNINDVNLL